MPAKMNMQEFGVLGSIFGKYQYLGLDYDERPSIKDLVEGGSRPRLASPRPQYLQNSSLAAEILELWERKDRRLFTKILKEVGATSEPRTTNGAHSDSRINTTRLPDGHPVYKLRRAKRYFQEVDKLPPFVIRSRKDTTKLAILPLTDGLRPGNPTRFVELVLRSWDKDHSFWTLDHNGRRYIVQHFARDGGRWQAWKRRELFSSRLLPTHQEADSV